MKVKDLIAKLTNLDPEIDILCCCEDEGLRSSESEVQVLEILDVSEKVAEMSRVESGKPWLKFEKSDTSSKVALIEVTTDF